MSRWILNVYHLTSAVQVVVILKLFMQVLVSQQQYHESSNTAMILNPSSCFSFTQTNWRNHRYHPIFFDIYLQQCWTNYNNKYQPNNEWSLGNLLCFFLNFFYLSLSRNNIYAPIFFLFSFFAVPSRKQWYFLCCLNHRSSSLSWWWQYNKHCCCNSYYFHQQ